ncbi:hypothetical protein GCM10012320_14490 [Sinomonas cellulolyticus]|uniref:Cobalamin-independent methionine synthase MetE C-terminal/archaeal domain-containing protein n=1 Tax=Sinomonas cellulolyticus TaxID=2801916 RepID=A0ABS1K0H1_9MICC|nr:MULTISPECIES: hypothetical protein [Sinomonas]MBL0704882.1 hypothetical protein [Sinomonas cellulolyticus]GHG47589.1 hypothetical protein GCM10012320_14490 [Sinomonas sp. KCTC 49339]
MTGQVTATALGDWPGSDPFEAAKAIRGELGSPHLPFLAELPQRGVGSDAIGRTASLLVDLYADVQPHGWRVVPRPGRDAQRARSSLATDLNVLADVVGSEERSAEDLQVRIVGPLSLMAALYLPSGERILADHGARRDLAQSLAAGVVPFLERVSRAVPGARLTVQLDEPDAARVLGGLLPTASGYRTLRSVPGEEARAAWAVVADALRDAGAEAVVVNLPAWEAPIGRVLAAGADGVSLPLADLTVAQWEELAGAVESGARVWLGALPVETGTVVRTGELAERVVRPWRQLGLPFSALDAVRLAPAGSLADLTPSQATACLGRVVTLADAVNQIALG